MAERRLAQWLFRYRSFTPLPWVLAAAAFAQPLGWVSAAGAAVALAGEGLRLWAVGYIGPESRVTRAGPGASRLVTAGPYGWVRNPLYLGNILIIVGLALWSRALWPWLPAAALAFFLWQYGLITALETATLTARYGWEYRAYKAVVPAWLPRFIRHPRQAGGPWRLSGGALRGELPTLNTLLLVGVLTALAPWLRRQLGWPW